MTTLPAAVPHARRIAGFWRRIGAFCFDMAILFAVGFGAGLVFPDYFASFGPRGRLLGLAIEIAYFTLLNSAFGGGQTLGKRLLGIRVVERSGEPPSVGKSFVRACVLCAPFAVTTLPTRMSSVPLDLALAFANFAAGAALVYLFAANRATRQSLHDLAVGSYVVDAASAGPVAGGAIWRGHFAIIGGLLAACLAAAYIFLPALQRLSVGGLIAARRTLESMDHVQTASVQLGKVWSGGAVKRFATVGAAVYPRPDDFEATAVALARRFADEVPEVEDADTIVAQVSYGYDIGIARYWDTKRFKWTPLELFDRSESIKAAASAPLGAAALAGGWASKPVLLFDNAVGSERWSVDAGSGSFTHYQTDFRLLDTPALGVTRIYANHSSAGAFGIGTAIDYDAYLTGDALRFTYLDLNLPVGSQAHFIRISPGASLDGAVFRADPSKLGGVEGLRDSTISWNGSGWTLHRADGISFLFPAAHGDIQPGQGAIVGVDDGAGHRLRVERDEGGNVLSITLADGTTVAFRHDGKSRITRATDGAEHVVRYFYDDAGRLARVADSAEGITRYSYDTTNNLVAVEKPGGATWISVGYDDHGRATGVKLESGESKAFRYAATGAGAVASPPAAAPSAPPGARPLKPMTPPFIADKLKILDNLRARRFANLDAELTAFATDAEKDVTHEADMRLAFQAFENGDPALDAPLAEWVSTSPRSSAAHLARAVYFTKLGWRTRGRKSAGQTSEQSFARMNQLFARGGEEVQAALALDSKLAVALMLRVQRERGGGSTASCYQEGQEALKVIPASFVVRLEIMKCLQPRWGGSEEAMQRFAAVSQQFVAQNPRLSVLKGFADFDRANEYASEEDYGAQIDALNEAIAKGGDDAMFYQARGEAFSNLKISRRALEDFERANQLWPQNQETLESIAREQAALQDYRSSLDTLELGSRIGGPSAYAQELRAFLLPRLAQSSAPLGAGGH